MDIICWAAIGTGSGAGCAGLGVGVTFACAGAGAGLGAGVALACSKAGVRPGFGFARAGTAAGAGFAFAVALDFIADFGFFGVTVGAGVAVVPCVAQDCHGQVQHIALAGSVRSINADAAKGTVAFAFIEPLPFTVVSQVRASDRFLILLTCFAWERKRLCRRDHSLIFEHGVISFSPPAPVAQLYRGWTSWVAIQSAGPLLDRVSTPDMLDKHQK